MLNFSFSYSLFLASIRKAEFIIDVVVIIITNLWGNAPATAFLNDSYANIYSEIYDIVHLLTHNDGFLNLLSKAPERTLIKYRCCNHWVY